MQRIGGRLRQMEREVRKKAREESAAEAAKQIGRALLVVLCARISGDGWAAACTVPMCAVQIMDGGFFPLIAAAGGMARLLFGMGAEEAFVLPDTVSVLLAAGIGLWLRRSEQNDYLTIPLLCAAVFFPRTFAVRLSAADWVRLILQVGITACAFPVFRTAMTALREEPRRTPLSEGEAAALFLTAATALMGGIPLRIFGFSPMLCLLFFSVMAAAHAFGVGLGCACGAVMGLAAAAALSGEWLMIGNLVLCALACAMFRSLGKIPAALAFLLTNAVLTLWINGSSTVILDLKETLPAAVLFVLIPTERVRESVRTAALQVHVREPDAEKLQMREKWERLGEIAQLLDTMSASVRTKGEREQEDAFPARTTEKLRQEVCAKCGLGSICWKRDAAFTERSMLRAAADAAERGFLEPRRLEPVFARRCMKTASVIDGVNRAAALYLSEEKWKAVFAGQRALLAEQLADTAALLREWMMQDEREAPQSAQARYRLRVGIAQCAAEDENGDSVLSEQIRADRHLLILSDGMGRGAAAREESRAATELLRSFLSFGMTEEEALERTNRLLLLKNESEMFTTVDLCLFDLEKGELSWDRVAAAGGILITDGVPRMIRTEALPMGVTEEPRPERLTVQMKAGDGVILLSDGVTDVAGDEVLLSIAAPLIADAKDDARALAESLLFAVQNCAEGDCDDMSVAAAILSEV